jgi:hypothetical protein
VTSLQNRFYHWIRHPSARSLAGGLQANCGVGRKPYEGFGGVLAVATVYLEITPA